MCVCVCVCVHMCVLACVCRGCGVKAGGIFIMIVFSITLFYYTLGNVSPCHRSSLKSIQLVTVAKSTDISKYGIDTILKPSLEAIKELEDVSRSITVYMCIRH